MGAAGARAERVAAFGEAVALFDEVEVFLGLELGEVREEEAGVGWEGVAGGLVAGGEAGEEFKGFEGCWGFELGVAEFLEEEEAGGGFLFGEEFGAGEGLWWW